MLLLTIAIVLGVLDVRRWSSDRWPRFLIDSLHRNVSLLALAFLVVHILTSVLDSFAPISLTDAVIPFAGAYRPFWLGLGAVAFDLIIAVIATSLLRARLGYNSWRAVHWLTYASWPIALLHGFGTGSDVKSTWFLALSVLCLLAVLRRSPRGCFDGWPHERAIRSAALGGAGIFSLFLLLWLPGGPLGSEWARRSGTPAVAAAAPLPYLVHLDRGPLMAISQSTITLDPPVTEPETPALPRLLAGHPPGRGR